ncbi:GNAT family N-acetyltransferase [Leptothrix discophora]|uniref:GNAT family N-acetyltransferase n=1 Tax=Leptothrix discophora TaxID=89 RepID=A0ABT9G0P5_LEPDI|nr:GNAT family N-acetyltransferase [Leptothrix discophora]MDP4300058.1 GNAT family N-acetyltransferase [Leptothrix discophora]
MSTPDITIQHQPEHRRFIAEVDGHLCEAAYRWREDGRSIVLNHTEVSPALQGRGIAAALVRVALDWVRTEGLTVVPSCSYVRTYMRRHRDTQDLLAPGQSL